MGNNPGVGVPTTPARDGGPAPEAGAGATLLASVKLPTGMALDASNIYLSSATDAIVQVPRGGGAAEPVATGLHAPAASVIAQGQLFFLETADVATMTLPKSPVSLFASDVRTPEAIGATSTDVYWLELVQPQTYTLQVTTLPIAGGAKRAVTTHDGQPTAGPLLLWNGFVYFGTSDATGVLLRASLTAGGAPAETFALVPDGVVTDLVTDGVTLYIGVAKPTGDSGKIQSTPLAGGGAIATLVEAAGHPGHVAVGGGIVYWTRPYTGEVRAIPASGGSEQVLATGYDGAAFIAVDDAVYFTFAGGLARAAR
jgi:hypothetical protein